MNNTNLVIKFCIKKNIFIGNIILILLTACISHSSKPTHAEQVFSEIKVHKKHKKLRPVPINIPEFKQTISNISDKYYQAKINVSVHEIDAREFFMGLVVDSEQNIIVHPEVSGRISLNLKNVTVPQILKVVQQIYGYDYKKTEIGYIIYPITLQTKIFKMNRLDLLREGHSSTLVTSAQNDVQNESNTQQQNNNNNNNQQNPQTVSSWVKTTSNTDFWEELNTALKAIISPDSKASVIINRQSGLIIARAKSTQLREIKRFLDSTQKQINRQVILQAKILEVILNDGHKDGVDWKSIIREGLQTAPLLTGAPGTIYTLASRQLSFRARDFTAVVDLLETQGKINVLSSPRISTLNNQKAIIKVGQNEYFITNVSSSNTNNINNVNTTSFPQVNFQSFFSGISLDVTPQINDADEITLHIHPSISQTKNLNKNFTIFGQAFSIPTALNTIRESDSIVKIRNGQVIVLGGLMQDREVDNNKGITLLSRIPYLGHLFRVDTGDTQKSELIILLKATVINDDADWQQDLNSSEQRIKKLNSEPRWKRAF